MRWFAKQAKEWGPLGVSCFAFVIACIIAMAYFAGPHGYDAGKQIIDPPPGIPDYLKEDLAAGVDENGRELVAGPTVGASSDQSYPRPRELLAQANVKYEWSPTTIWSSRWLYKPEAIVVHVTAGGTCSGIVNYFKSNDRNVSAHFVVCDDKVVQQVEVGDAAHTQGIWGAKVALSNPLIKRHYVAGANPNWWGIGIETVLAVGQHIDNFPGMRRNLIELIAALAKQHNIIPSRETVIGHFELDGTNRPIDPICCMSLDAIVQEAAALVYGRGTPPPAPPVAEWGACDPIWPHVCFSNWRGVWVNQLNDYTFDGTSWTDAQGRPEWGETGAFGERWNFWLGLWVSADGTHHYDEATGWYCVRDCAPLLGGISPDSEIVITPAISPPACCIEGAAGSPPEVSERKDGNGGGLVLIIGTPTMAAIIGALYLFHKQHRGARAP